MIGKICKAYTPYYSLATGQMSYKGRPALVLGHADNDDFVVLPVSSVSKKENLHPIYDVEVDPVVYPKLNLRKVSYIRTHKQTIVHKAELRDEIGDLKSEYEDLYVDILEKRERFNNQLTEEALQL